MSLHTWIPRKSTVLSPARAPPCLQMNEDYELDVTRAEACAMMRREFACVRTVCGASEPAYRSSDLQVCSQPACRAICRCSKSSHIKDAKTMDVLTFKGRQHLEEVKQQYKVRAQLAYLFEPPDHSAYAATHGAEKESTESAFLQKFYAGTA